MSVLDTGFTVDDLERKKRGQIQRLVHWEWGNQQSGVLAQTKFVDTLRSPVGQGTLLLQTGQRNSGMSRLLESLKDSDSNVRRAAAEALGAVAQAAPALADRVLDPLLAALRDSDSKCALGSSRGVGVVAQAAPALADRVLDPLLAALRDSDSNVRQIAAAALKAMIQVAPALVDRVLAPLLAALRDSNFNVR